MPSADEWINKILYIRTTEYYVATKINGVLVLAATWIKLGSIIRSEKSLTYKTKDCLIPFICMSRTGKIYRDIKYISGCLGLRGRDWRGIGLLIGLGFVLKVMNVLKLIAVLVT